jgi:hypothetical protein
MLWRAEKVSSFARVEITFERVEITFTVTYTYAHIRSGSQTNSTDHEQTINNSQQQDDNNNEEVMSCVVTSQ